MSGALKMARLDQYSMKSPFGMYGTLLVVLFLLSFTGLSPMSAAITTAWVMALHLPMIFLVQEKDALERLYASLALSDCEVVVGRYLYICSAIFSLHSLWRCFSVCCCQCCREKVPR